MRVVLTNLVLFEKAPFLALERLGALFVIAPLNGVAHGRHVGVCSAVRGRGRGRVSEWVEGVKG